MNMSSTTDMIHIYLQNVWKNYVLVSGLFTDCWATYTKRITVTSCSKEWWNNKCRTALETYRQTGKWSDWSLFCSTTKQTKRQFFDNRITKIASTNKRPWDLMSWVKQ